MTAPAPERDHERRSYGQFCPLARSLDVLGERWTLLVVRELLTGPKRYRDLRDALPGMWSNLLARRLRDLQAAGLVERRALPPAQTRSVYELTERGRALGPALYELARFGLPYLDMPTEEQPLTAHALDSGLRALVLIEALPSHALTVHLVLDEGQWTLRVHAPQPGPLADRVVVSTGPPDEADVVVRSSAPILLWLRRHDLSYDDALAADLVHVDGDPASVDAFLRMFGIDAPGAA
ncbi:MAG TPA: helix-turn-helix domain-containing protein [Acidimicrobiia bacterium]